MDASRLQEIKSSKIGMWILENVFEKRFCECCRNDKKKILEFYDKMINIKNIYFEDEDGIISRYEYTISIGIPLEEVYEYLLQVHA